MKERIKDLAFLFCLEVTYPWMLIDRELHHGYDLDYYEKYIVLRHHYRNLLVEPNSVEGLKTLVKAYEQHRKQQTDNSLRTG